MRTQHHTQSHRRHWGASIVVSFALAMAACTSDDSSSTGSASSSSGGGGASSGESPTKIDACALVTADDAATVFGKPAAKDTTSGVVVDPNFLRECHWTYEQEDPSTGGIASQNVSIYVWRGAQYYSKTPGAEDFAIGDGGNIKVDKAAGIDVEWVQQDTTLLLSYFTIGFGIDPATKAEAMKSLAKSVNAKLAGPT